MSWEKVKLGDLATFVNGYAFKPTDWSDHGLEIIRIQNLTKSGAKANYFSDNISDKYKVVKGDILISWSATLGVFEWKGADAWLNQHIFKVVFDKEEIDKSFFVYLIEHILDDLKSRVHGATMKHITKGNFDNTLVPLPPLPIQEKIAAILDKADALRRKDQELLKKYDELAQAIFIDMFGDPVKNEKGWEVKRLGEVAMLQGGYAFKSKDFTNEGVRLVKITNVHNNTLIWDEVDFLPDEFLKKYNNFSLHAGDIVMAMTRPVIKSLNGIKVIRVYESDLPCLLNQRVGRFVFRDKIINGVFLYALCNTQYFKDKIEKLSSVSLQPNISSKQVENIEIFLPPITIQEAFTKKIELINQLKAQTNAEKSEELFQSLLQRAFKGELVR